MTLGISVNEIIEKSNNPLLNIPPSWERVLLKDVAKVLNGFAFESSKFSPSEGFPLLRIRDIGKDKTEAYYSGEFDRAYIIQSGDLVIGMDGDFNCARWKGSPALLNQRVCKIIINSQQYYPKFLDIVLPGYLKAINENTSSVTVKHLSSITVSEIPLPYPPLPEQERLVERIESLFTQLDAGVAGLKRAQAALKRYKASVLKAACEGRLVAQDPSVEPAVELLMKLGQEPLERDDLPELPEGWCWAFIGTVARKIQYGTSDKADNNSDGILVLRMGNLIDGQLDFKHLKFIQINSPGLSKLMLEPGDLLFNRTNSAELVGKTAVYKENHPKASFASYLIRVQMQPEILPDYISYYINSIYGRQYIMSVVSQQVGQANVNGTKLSKMPVPLPPSMEQYRIVAEVERRFSVVQELEQTIDANLKRAARLRQAILKRAFEGKLVGQDESVELLPPRKISTKEPVKKQDLEDPPEIESARQLELFD